MPILVGILGATWFAIGMALALIMGRRGHDAYAWLVLGMFLWPIALFLAVYTDRSPHRHEPRILAQPPQGTGPVDVLVGIDGSPESRAAVDTAIHLLGSRLGRLTLARAVPLYCGFELERTADQSLQVEAERLRPREVGLEVVEGHPASALTELAAAAGYELVVIGTRGAGLSRELLGSTAVALARHSKLPVLLVGSPDKGELE
jgi:nucleotide-binding universal stress UspA family protein